MSQNKMRGGLRTERCIEREVPPDKSRLLAELHARMLAELPPDERERIAEDPKGPEAVTFAISLYVRAGYPNLFENLKKPEL